jgi:CRISPR-associated protein Cas1
MPAAYIREQGSYIRLKNGKMAVTKGNSTLMEMPLFLLENISVFGNIQISTQAMTKFLQSGIHVSFFTRSGKYIGQACSGESKNIFLRLSQYEYYLDTGKRTEMAKRITENKINNQLAVIHHYRWTGNSYDWKADVEKIEEYKKSLAQKDQINAIMGVEGICSNIYFGCYGQMFKSEIQFRTRNRRPPKDPVNAVLSLVYSFLLKDLCTILETESFEMYLGFLHGVRYGRKSLSLDFIEEFRQPAGDRLVLYLFNKRILKQEDFNEENGGIFLTEVGFRKFCTEYEKWISKEVEEGKNYREIQSGKLKKAIQYREDYVPYQMRI